VYGDRQEHTPGVYAIDDNGALTLLHEYQDGEYSLEDLLEEFGFGHAEGDTENGDAIIALNAQEVRELKINADAYSFDYDEGFIEMCLDIERYATGATEDRVRLVSID
jgi:5'-3' exonuclease